MVQDQLVLFATLACVLLAEHVVLTRLYEKRSSLQRIFVDRNFTAKADLVYAAFYSFGLRYVVGIAALMVLPGIAYVAVGLIRNHFEIQPLLGNWTPANSLVAIAVWLVLLDLPGYLTHVAMHKVPFLWRFHELHHSATEMNIVTGSRISLGERFFNDFGRLVMLSFMIGLPDIRISGVVLLIRRIIDKLQHSDLPWDYGLLGYIIASPRFHRLHHSSNPEDFDANYGNIFSFWDYLFGTVADRYRTSSAVADTCDLGLRTAEQTSYYTRWVPVLFEQTFFPYLVRLWRWLTTRNKPI